MSGQALSDPWFWAFLAAVGWALGFGIVGTRTLGRHLWFGVPVFLLAEVPRVLLPLPFVSQPRIDVSPPLFAIAGAVVLMGSLIFGTPVFRIVPLTTPDRTESLRTSGLYSIVRHPLMVCDILWPLGWSLILGSLIGILLMPVWLLVIWALTHVEEDSLIREYGAAYREFQARVPRLLPRLPGRGGTRAADR